LLEGKENLDTVSDTAGPAPDVGDIQVGMLNRPEMQSGLEFVIVRPAGMEEASKPQFEHAWDGIHDEMSRVWRRYS